MLDTDEINTILKEVMLGIPSSIKTKEAIAFRRKIIKEIRNRPKGTTVEIPGEFLSPETNEEFERLSGR